VAIIWWLWEEVDVIVQLWQRGSHDRMIVARRCPVRFFSQPADLGHYVSTIQAWTPPCHYHTIMATSLSQLYDHVHFFSQPSDNGHYVSTIQAWTPPCHYHTIMATSLSQLYDHVHFFSKRPNLTYTQIFQFMVSDGCEKKWTWSYSPCL
jgi:hypothetical protein